MMCTTQSFFLALVVAIGGGMMAGGCRRQNPAEQATSHPTRARAELHFEPRNIGHAVEGTPWITDLIIVDLDGDGWRDVVACEGKLNQVLWIRQTAPGVYDEQSIGDPVAGPAHVEIVDIDHDGDRDVLVASMGQVTPSNEKTGSVVVLENLGEGRFVNHVVLERTHRVTSVDGTDLDGDGDVDLAVGQFGYLEGQVQWLENLGDWHFASHALLDLAGTVHAPIVDLNADGHPDVVAVVSQDWEEVHAFDNHGAGKFSDRILYGSTNKDYGSSGLVVADVDRDGDSDLVYTNGDGFDYATPGARPWHGVQWLENDGGGRFTFHRIGDFPGAYSPLVIDLDGDGDRDVVVVSGFNDWSKADAVSLAWFENDGAQHYLRHDLAHAPTHLVVLDGADMDNDGDVELVTGGFYFYPPYDRVSRITLWKRVR